ncbi:MAG TPA: sensor histidine kinase [Euzebyales bacterium]|nr:sensor histidine kinase [Euzebyales bacterium]
MPATALVVLPLLGRRHFPFAAPLAVWAVAVAVSFVDPSLVVATPVAFLAGLGATFLLGSLRDDVAARAGLAVTVASAAIIVLNDPTHTVGDALFVPVQFMIAWFVGWALQRWAAQAESAEERALQAEREQASAARLAVAEERARIARELHDIVAHAVSVMVLQVGAVRHELPPDRAADREALLSVERTGRAALAEMRQLLGAMHHDGQESTRTPQPGLDRLAALAGEVGRAGLPVRVQIDGDPPALPRAVDLSAYRIVQEGLTNALKHAGAGRADVRITFDPDALEIEVRDDGRGSAAGDGLGHGLVGVRERVKIYGGEMAAGTTAEGGFALRARLPIKGDRP